MRTTVTLVFAIVVAFAAGATSGYAARTVTAPVAAAATHSAAACPQGSHAAVWYSARTWACVSDQGASTP